jgi:pimeloyl-ACP methyl ester carboxylesterase
MNVRRRGSGEALVLVHPTANAWAPVLPVLAEHYECITPDLPGFGSSRPLPDGQPPTIERLADAVERALGKLGRDRVRMVGNSLGATVVLELARRDRATRLVAIAPFGMGTRAENRRTKRRKLLARRGVPIVRPLAPLFVRTAVGRTVLGFNGYQLARPWRHEPAQMIETMDAYLRAPGYVSAVSHAVEYDGALEDIRCPTTIVWGEKDRVLPTEQARRFAERIPGADTRLLLGCGHVPMSDDADLVASTILAGLEEGYAVGGAFTAGGPS